MKSSLAATIGFILGGVTSAFVTYRLLKEKYEQLAHEEIDSVREFYRSKGHEGADDASTIEGQERKKTDAPVDYSLYNQLLGKYSSVEAAESSKAETVNKNANNEGERPYVISPGEFGEFEDYAQISLVYYADQILADDNDDLVDDIDETVGIDSLSHFGEYEDDSVFVRNDTLKCDYEILLDQRKFSEVLALRPPTE